MTDGNQPGSGDESGQGGGGDQGDGSQQPSEPVVTPSRIGEYEIREGDRGKIVRKGD